MAAWISVVKRCIHSGIPAACRSYSYQLWHFCDLGAASSSNLALGDNAHSDKYGDLGIGDRFRRTLRPWDMVYRAFLARRALHRMVCQKGTLQLSKAQA
ncbi:hypothetical protein AG1IA_02244 [Rhizoctonia solani AG-1 IA]|uniref:Uncharacterized protein n=1 Tax=Thanatephorus cucumeris (strain AG1-IA) TaxID=983506 RepID=L8X087_THACA|nr:hypothetical protein AG1IA_02244 [Rhizoctonia solani AG-1 IA]